MPTDLPNENDLCWANQPQANLAPSSAASQIAQQIQFFVGQGASKARKDIEQAAALIRVLAEDRSDELEEAFLEARGRGPAWRQSVDQGARRLPPDAKRALEEVVQITD